MVIGYKNAGQIESFLVVSKINNIHFLCKIINLVTQRIIIKAKSIAIVGLNSYSVKILLDGSKSAVGFFLKRGVL